MMDAYPGEIRLFAGHYAPLDWAWCDGALLSIDRHRQLYAVLGTTYGGDGVDTFALPDLRGRVALHAGTAGGDTYVLGRRGGSESAVLTAEHLPVHTHAVSASRAAPAPATGPLDLAAASHVPATLGSKNRVYAAASAAIKPMAPGLVLPSSGDGEAHDNMAPFLALHFIIALRGQPID